MLVSQEIIVIVLEGFVAKDLLPEMISFVSQHLFLFKIYAKFVWPHTKCCDDVCCWHTGKNDQMVWARNLYAIHMICEFESM